MPSNIKNILAIFKSNSFKVSSVNKIIEDEISKNDLRFLLNETVLQNLAKRNVINDEYFLKEILPQLKEKLFAKSLVPPIEDIVNSNGFTNPIFDEIYRIYKAKNPKNLIGPEEYLVRYARGWSLDIFRLFLGKNFRNNIYREGIQYSFRNTRIIPLKNIIGIKKPLKTYLVNKYDIIEWETISTKLNKFLTNDDLIEFYKTTGNIPINFISSVKGELMENLSFPVIQRNILQRRISEFQGGNIITFQGTYKSPEIYRNVKIKINDESNAFKEFTDNIIGIESIDGKEFIILDMFEIKSYDRGLLAALNQFDDWFFGYGKRSKKPLTESSGELSFTNGAGKKLDFKFSFEKSDNQINLHKPDRIKKQIIFPNDLNSNIGSDFAYLKRKKLSINEYNPIQMELTHVEIESLALYIIDEFVYRNSKK